MSPLFASGGQSIGLSALTSVLPMNTQDGSPLGWTLPIYMEVVRLYWASLVAQLVKNLPAMQETPIRFLGWEDPLEYSSILAWPRVFADDARPWNSPGQNTGVSRGSS